MEAEATLDFFGLREQPFAPTADPSYFYATREHKECLFRLWSNIDNRHGIAAVLGNYGTGKTTLLRKLLIGMMADKEKYAVAVVGSPVPSWTSFALLEAIVGQFGLKPKERAFGIYMEALNQHLLKQRNRICTLIIDDSQNLNKRGQIELLRLVQNLETPQHKLLNLVLFAQLEWLHVLRAAPNFEQRINMTYTLRALELAEVREFIDFRISQAAVNESKIPIFDEAAVRVIHAYGEGNPRVTVTLCRNALLMGAQLKRQHIGQELLLHTIDKTTVPHPERQARVATAIMGTRAMPPRPAPPVKPAPPVAAAGNKTVAAPPPSSIADEAKNADRATQLLRARAKQQ